MLSSEYATGVPLRLSSSFEKDSVLTLNSSGKITFEKKSGRESLDSQWRLVPVDDGVLLKSMSDYDVCHFIEDAGDIKLIHNPNDEAISGCVWKIGKSGEIYQPHPDGGERYLWMADGKMFVTLDGFLAESWIPLSDFTPKKKAKQYEIFWIGVIILIIILLYIINEVFYSI